MNTDDRTLWMGDLESYMDATFIGEAFHKMGEEVRSVKIVYDKYNGRATGYCFVELNDGDAARRSMLNINGKVIPKSKPPITFNLSFANSPNAPYTEYNLFVNNIPIDLDDSGLFLVFGERYRSCRGAKVYRNPDGTSRGLGFVRFADQTDQQKALVEMNKHNVNGQSITLKLAQPKFRAPRKSYGNQQYDPNSYYPQHQDAYQQPGAAQYQMYEYQPNRTMGHQMGAGAFQMGLPPTMVTMAPMPTLVVLQQPPHHQMMMQPQPMMTMQAAHPMPIMQPHHSDMKPIMTHLVPINPEMEPENYHEEVDLTYANENYMHKSEEVYQAIEESRWCPKLLTANIMSADVGMMQGY